MKNLLASAEGGSSKKSAGGIPSWVLVGWAFALAVALAVVATLVAVGKIDLGKSAQGITGKIGSWFVSEDKAEKGEKSAYSAVFLANGQVYFGKLSQAESQYPVLKDVFYLRVQRRLQPPEDEGDAVKQETQLIKLGEELHGPVDEIKINRDQVLFIERMRPDSRVVQGIEKFYQQKK